MNVQTEICMLYWDYQGNENYLSSLQILKERISNDCRKTKTKGITPTDHNWSEQFHEPIRIPSNYL